VLYVGKAKDLKSRVSSYFVNSSLLGEKTRVLVSQIATIETTEVESEVESLLLEAHFIKKFQPKYNVRMTDNKSYPLIRITLGHEYPAVLLARKMDDDKSLYFGPYPNAGAVKMVLKIIRRIFPFQSVANHPKRICLYHHLGLCPCPPMHDSPNFNKQYRQQIRNIIRILEGKSRVLMQELEKERDMLSTEERFEEAAAMQKKINALSIITQPFRKPFEYDVNPNLREDIRQQEISLLQQALTDSGLEVSSLNRIECYDISNIQGTNATGSLVVLTQGEIDKSQYRKFKIRKDGKPNDFAMMQEMLQRRLKHDDWAEPDLMIIDGGKGQLSSALEAMNITGRYFPVVGLAKREETIIIPVTQQNYHPELRKEQTNGIKLYGSNEEHFIELSLPKASAALHLIQRIRNEAHRFAVTYHKKLRGKAALAM
jgi:excinuclease ABC subunit C